MNEGFSLGADIHAHVVSCCRGRMKGQHILQSADWEKVERQHEGLMTV